MSDSANDTTADNSSDNTADNSTSTPSPRRRGALPTPRSALAAAQPHFPLPVYPFEYLVKPAQLSMWGNDVHGDCVTAEEAFAKACHSPEIFISEAEVISWATSHGVLEGAYLVPVMTTMQTDGFSTLRAFYDDGSHESVDWTTMAGLRSAIAQGPVKLGIAADQLDGAWLSTGGNTGWVATGFHSDGAEDHCVSLCGYGSMSWLAQQLGVALPAGVDGSAPGYALYTWKSIGIIDAPSMVAITHEAWLRTPTTIVHPRFWIDILIFVLFKDLKREFVEVHLATGTGDELKPTLDLTTAFRTDATGTYQMLANQDLAFVQTSHTKSGHAEIHTASRASNYQSVSVVETNLRDWSHGVWQLLDNQDLGFVATTGTASGRVEVFLSTHDSDYRGEAKPVETAFEADTSGTWQLVAGGDLAHVTTGERAQGDDASCDVEILIASRESDYTKVTTLKVGDFGASTGGTFQLQPNLDLVFIQTAGTRGGATEVHTATAASNYRKRTVASAPTFGTVDASDGTWSFITGDGPVLDPAPASASDSTAAAGHDGSDTAGDSGSVTMPIAEVKQLQKQL